jgi:hypothetical protein
MNQCPFCLRAYKIKVYFNRHVAACELLRRSTSDRNDEIEANADIPDSRKLYEMVLVLAQKNKALEEKVEELSKRVTIKKKKLHLKDWLDQNYSSIQTFDLFMLTKKITQDDYKIVCKYDYIEGITMILKNIFPTDSESSLPIRAFEQKDNTFFVKNDDGWNTMSTTELEGLIASIGKQLMTLFVLWQEKNKHRLTQDSYIEEYMDILQKMLGSSHSSEVIIARIKKSLYKHLKTNLKNVMQVEIIV